VGQVIRNNPAASVRGPKHAVKKGKTPVLAADEARALVDVIDTGLMVCTFARVGAAMKMQAEDVYVQGRRTRVRLHEKGGKRHECRDHLDEYLHAYTEGRQLGGDLKGYLFGTAVGRTGRLSERAMAQADAYRMIRRRVEEAGIRTRIGCHTFRATGITEYLRNGGKLEIAPQMADYESARTAGLYDRRNDRVSLDEVERILI